jgi:hypothetical protein
MFATEMLNVEMFATEMLNVERLKFAQICYWNVECLLLKCSMLNIWNLLLKFATEICWNLNVGNCPKLSKTIWNVQNIGNCPKLSKTIWNVWNVGNCLKLSEMSETAYMFEMCLNLSEIVRIYPKLSETPNPLICYNNFRDCPKMCLEFVSKFLNGRQMASPFYGGGWLDHISRCHERMAAHDDCLFRRMPSPTDMASYMT